MTTRPAYSIRRVSPALVLIRWYTIPDDRAEQHYLEALEQVLNDCDRPCYFLSDLRKGRIITLSTLQALGALAHHPNWAGSTAFGDEPFTQIMVGSFQMFARSTPSANGLHTHAAQALAFLESLQPGITQGIDWETLLAD
ncbi:MAG: hypothetical protein SF162_20800 [bacterium]|nr:hypothetical protein [bacterium]